MHETYDLLAHRLFGASSAKPGSKYLVGIAGPPGAGKSTLANEVSGRVNKLHQERNPGLVSEIAIAVPMDGFHLYKHQLDAMEDPEEAHARRGAPWTFNPSGLVDCLKALRSQQWAYFPSFDHGVGDPVEQDILVSPKHKVVLVEGNYLLLEDGEWKELKNLFDERWENQRTCEEQSRDTMSQGSTPSSSTPGSPCSGSPPHPTALPAFLGQSVIPIMNKLQDIFAQLGSPSTVDLPQLVHVQRKMDDREFSEWGEFLHLPGRRFTDFSHIRKEIQAETERELGDKKGVSDKQIRLKIFSPNVLNITLVDLPGLTRVPVGDQPSDIESRIRAMILSYIKHATCIILAVSPANTDLSNSDSLQMAKLVDPDGSRTIGVVTKLDIMDRGTDARSILLGTVIPLRLGYVGVVNRSQEVFRSPFFCLKILMKHGCRIFMPTNRSRMLLLRKSIFSEVERCTKAFWIDVASLNSRKSLIKYELEPVKILVQHIKTVLPELKTRINTQMVALLKELTSYGEATDSKSGQGAMLLNALTKYFHVFSSVIDGKNQEMSTSELSGGARIHYIFQSIFVKSLEEVDPCDDLTDEDIRTAIQNATGPKMILFVPEVPFEVLVRRQIERLLDPCLQCARFIYDELVKMSHRCETNELQRFPVLRRRIEEAVSTCLREGLTPTETMISHLVDMEMDYINTSHPRFIGGSKAVETALQQQRGSKDALEWKESGADRLPKSARPTTAQHDKPAVPSGTESSSTWGISSIFGHHEKAQSKDPVIVKAFPEPLQDLETKYSTIILKEPPGILRATDAQTEQERVEVAVTRLLLKSYYEIVRKNIQDAVPKAIMHFLVGHVKRELLNLLIKKLYREVLFEEMLQERDDIASRRKHCREVLRVLQQAVVTLEDLPVDADAHSRPGQALFQDSTGLPKPQGVSTYLVHEGGSAALPSYSHQSPRHVKAKQRSPLYSDQHLQQQQVSYSNGSSMAGYYAPTVKSVSS
ncbi:hypothetical protein SELMODRAFT_404911 [Selaginella moellendorffii]|uniref:Dynamin GTPase n=1 Tax=Selaginella moellendorffii TaxID=88036 RepID=D8QXS3_SELML|nr:hypothetical protein SELMODRAFT_404911 [Selaginella moellendorffii]